MEEEAAEFWVRECGVVGVGDETERGDIGEVELAGGDEGCEEGEGESGE